MTVRSLRALGCVLAAGAVLATSACGAPGRATVTPFRPLAHAQAHVTVHKAAVLHPTRKYYGVFTPSAPAHLGSIDQVTKETGKQPNLDLYFQAWGAGAAQGTPNFSVNTASNACYKGMLPLYTWESWNTSDRDANGGVAWSQPDFAPSVIASGRYDAYIRATADRIKNVPCPIAIRFDQEPNGYWYPWGITTDGMPGTTAERAADYVQMWHHVVSIFRDEHVTNALWVWSPNIQGSKMPPLTETYPGPHYTDWVGIDGYYYDGKDPQNTDQKFHDVFSSTIDQLKVAAPHKPWMIAETGVAAGVNKPQMIKNLLRQVAKRKRFNGFVYFDQDKPNDRSDWRFDDTQASLDAFKAGVNRKAYAAGKPRP